MSGTSNSNDNNAGDDGGSSSNPFIDWQNQRQASISGGGGAFNNGEDSDHHIFLDSDSDEDDFGHDDINPVALPQRSLEDSTTSGFSVHRSQRSLIVRSESESSMEADYSDDEEGSSNTTTTNTQQQRSGIGAAISNMFSGWQSQSQRSIVSQGLDSVPEEREQQQQEEPEGVTYDDDIQQQQTPEPEGIKPEDDVLQQPHAYDDDDSDSDNEITSLKPAMQQQQQSMEVTAAAGGATGSTKDMHGLNVEKQHTNNNERWTWKSMYVYLCGTCLTCVWLRVCVSHMIYSTQIHDDHDVIRHYNRYSHDNIIHQIIIQIGSIAPKDPASDTAAG